MPATRSNPVLRRRHHRIAALLGIALTAFPAAVFAGAKVDTGNAMPRSKFDHKPAASNKLPVLLDADQVDYDHDHNIVTATGHVQVAQGNTIILADKLIYNRDTDQLWAQGNVAMLDPSGNVFFSDHLELEDEMKLGVVDQFRARLSDNSVMTATQANRVSDSKMELFKAAYTPCEVCNKQGQAVTPSWQIYADHVTIDQEAQEVTYDNAWMNLYGVPVLYTPYFSHATPGADNQSGLIMPEYQHSNTLGSVFKVPVYYSINPDKDATFIPIYTTEQGEGMGGQYRQMFDSGLLTLQGSFMYAPNVDALGNPIAGHEVLGDISGLGAFRIDPTYDWGFNFHRASDSTYLARYGFDNEPMLESRVYAEGAGFEGTNDRSYGVIQALSFQGLTEGDSSKVIPIVAPLTDVTFQSDPGLWNSRLTLDGDAMSLYREEGPESRRLSGTAGWKIPYISDDGQVIQFNAQMRTDIYSVNDVPLSNGTNFSGVTGREVPQVSGTWQYPFINQMKNMSFTIEPIVSVALSPNGGNPQRIPNEDSLLPEFSDSNLFDADRFSGLDRVESGPRISYGVRGQAEFDSKTVDLLFGQEYRTDDDLSFPIASQLDSHLSDYVGKVGVNYMPFSLAYRFRLDREDLAATHQEVDGGFNYYPVNLSLSYLTMRDDPILATAQSVIATANINITKQWIWTVTADRDLLHNQFVETGTGLIYQNECMNVSTLVGRLYTEEIDIKPSTTFLLTLSMKNLD